MRDYFGELTGQVSLVYGLLPLYTFQNDMSTELGITTRKTQLGFEDNDHKYRKSATASFDVAIMGRNRRTWLGLLKKYCREGYQSTLVVLTNYQIMDNMVITKVEEHEEFKDGNVIYVKLTFSEIRHGAAFGTALNDADTTGTTKQQPVFNSVQSYFNMEFQKIQQVFLGS